MKKKTLIALAFSFVLVGWSIYYYPYEYGRLWHLLKSDPHIYDPIVLKRDVKLTESRQFSFDLDYRHYDYHDVGLIFDEGSVISHFSKTADPYKFQGKIKIELLNHGNIVRETTVTEPLSYKFDKENINFYRSAVLDRFPLPFKGKYKGFKLRITILEADPVWSEGDVDIYLSISTRI